MTNDGTWTAKAIAKKLIAAGYGATVESHGYAVKILNQDVGAGSESVGPVAQLAILWLPIGEPTPTQLGFKYLWGRTGDEHQAEDNVGVDELVRQVVETLPSPASPNLETILAGYRAQVQPAWSKDTALAGHPDAADGSPVGQCGATSAWLQRRLLEDHGITTLFCVGFAMARGRTMTHCWLQMGDTVIDLTVDQAWPDAPFVAARQGGVVRYQTERRLTVEDVEEDPVVHRMRILEQAVTR